MMRRSTLPLFAAVAYLSISCDSPSNPTQPTVDQAAIQLAAAGASIISAGENHSCAIRPNKTAACWGKNGDGQLGDGTGANRSTPVPVVGLTNVIAIAAGRFHTCAILLNGTGRCWGSNSSGQLGNGGGGPSRTPVVVSGLSGAVAVSSGAYHSCALLGNGTARCWGFN
ncbi:MAG TPA: hypothetical protein VFU03_09675, partial [Gemmatimonadales bacterium]|nr:hypothetical protein [Gemmatimonadales bacterium]